jgi:hypothetical protein
MSRLGLEPKTLALKARKDKNINGGILPVFNTLLRIPLR